MYQEKLKQVQNELTQTEKIIADFFQNHSLEARSFTLLLPESPSI